MDVTLGAPAAEHDLSRAERRELENLGIKVEEGPATSIEPEAAMITVETTARSYAFASLYPALGSDIRSSLAVFLGGKSPLNGALTSTRTKE